jgi:hypothetical protein
MTKPLFLKPLPVFKTWKNSGVPDIKKQPDLLRRGIHLLEKARLQLKKDNRCLPEQPFDLHLLRYSPLYKRSRKLYSDQGGKFIATLVSSPRSLSSSILLDQIVEYSPIERELIWSATDPIESTNSENLLKLRTYSSSLFHEQNHRIIWKLLPLAPSEKNALRRYLNFAESLVITLDMALADHLGPQLASLFYLTGVIYDPGTFVAQEVQTSREYRNYLQSVLHATYLNLELYDPLPISKTIQILFPTLGQFAERATRRSLNLDTFFIQNTNLSWQKQHYKKIIQSLSSKNAKNKTSLELSENPLDNHRQYLIAEQLFDLFLLK